MTGPFLLAGGFLLALAVSGPLTALLIRWAPRLGLVDQPTARKVHAQPTPRAGGLAIATAMLVSAAVWSAGGWDILGPACAILLLGLADDLRPLPWLVRLLGQTAVAAVVVLRWPCEAELPARLLALAWLVGLTNAFNMLDNMDLLSGGTAAIAAGVLALAALCRHDEGLAVLLLALGGALAGFLWFNRPPARIFMGDAGSNFLGFVLGAFSLDDSLVTRTLGPTWAVPPCVLAVPWYDLLTVVAIRLSQGKSPFHPDRQHLSHRLTVRGLSPVWAVRVIHLLGLVSGLGGLAIYLVSDGGAGLIFAGVVGGWTLLVIGEYRRRKR